MEDRMHDHDNSMEHAAANPQKRHNADMEAHVHEHQSHMASTAHGHHTGVTPPTHGRHAVHTVEAFRKRFWISLAVTIPILLLTPQIQKILGVGKELTFQGQTYLLFALSSFVYFYGGLPFLQGMVREIREKLPGMMTLIGVAITVAFVYSTATVFGLPGMPFFWELATLIDIMLLGHWLEMKSISGASQALEQLARLMPPEAHKLMPDGSTADIPLDKLDIGNKVLVKPGEKIPADGTVIGGESSVNESMLTGESRPVQKLAGNGVIGGSINGEGSLTVEVKKTGADSFLSQVIDLVRQAQESKSRTQDLSDRVAFWLTVIALSVGVATFFGWSIVARQNIAFALERAVTVMVIACPHALGLAVPLVVAISTAIAAKNGLLIRNRIAFENARHIDAVIIDKTGTLTEGRFGVTDTISFNQRSSGDIGGSTDVPSRPGRSMVGHNNTRSDGSASDNGTDETDANKNREKVDGIKNEADILKYAASVEIYSEHPIAKAITGATKERLAATDFRNITGEGAQATIKADGSPVNVKIVSPAYLRKHNIGPIDDSEAEVERLSSQGKTVVVLLLNNFPAGAIALADIIRPESKQTIDSLKDMGIQTIMMTGDNKQVAEWVSKELGVDEFFAEVLPQQKAEKVKDVQSRGLVVAMVGDGVNDAPALAQANVGIAIGSGTDIAVETADIVLVRSNPQDIVSIIKLARSTYAKMIQNLAWATGYNTFAIPLATGIFYSYGILLSPALGAVLMSVSTIIVAFNARFLRLER